MQTYTHIHTCTYACIHTHMNAHKHQCTFTVFHWSQYLIYHNITDINFQLGQFLHQTFCLIQWQKLRNTDAHKCRNLLHRFVRTYGKAFGRRATWNILYTSRLSNGLQGSWTLNSLVPLQACNLLFSHQLLKGPGPVRVAAEVNKVRNRQCLTQHHQCQCCKGSPLGLLTAPLTKHPWALTYST